MGSLSKKPVVFLVHGLRGSHHGFRFVAEELGRNFEVVNWDIPGSGEAKELSTHNLEGYVEYFHEVISALPEKPIIVAHSMGTIIASRYVERYPEDVVGKMVLLAPIFLDKWQKRLNKVGYYLLRGVLAPLPKGARKRVLGARQVSWGISRFLTYDRSQQKWIDEEHYKYSGQFASAKSLMADVKISMTMEAVIPAGKEVLVVLGKGDRLSNAGVVRARVEKSAARYHEIGDAGHLMNYERPREVAGVVYEFLKTEL